LGDQAAVIASLVGDGIAFALSSAEAAATAFITQGSGAAIRFQPAFARRSAVPVKIASLLKYVGERPVLAGPMVELLRFAPSMLRRAATLTRVAAY
jgi:flavin-dependent dehydrogenase